MTKLVQLNKHENNYTGVDATLVLTESHIKKLHMLNPITKVFFYDQQQNRAPPKVVHEPMAALTVNFYLFTLFWSKPKGHEIRASLVWLWALVKFRYVMVE